MSPRGQPQRGPGHRPSGRSRSASPEHRPGVEGTIRVERSQRRYHHNSVPAARVRGRAQREHSSSSLVNLASTTDTSTKKGSNRGMKFHFDGFPPKHTSINPNLPLAQVVYYYPNHLYGDQIRRMVDAGWSAGTILEHMEPKAREQFLERETTDQPLNTFTKRLSVMRKRMAVEAEMAQPAENLPYAPALQSSSAKQLGYQPVKSSRRGAHRRAPLAPPPPPPPSPPPPLPPPAPPLAAADDDADTPPSESPLYMHRATFKVYVPFDPQNPSADQAPTEHNIYLPYNPPQITTADPLGILYQEPQKSQSSYVKPHTTDVKSGLFDQYGTTLSQQTCTRDHFTDDELSAAAAQMNANRISPPRYVRHLNLPRTDLNQLFQYPELDNEQQRQLLRPPSGATDGELLTAQDVPTFSGISIGNELDDDQLSTLFGTPKDITGFEMPSNMRWSPSRRAYVRRSPQSRKRSPQTIRTGFE